MQVSIRKEVNLSRLQVVHAAHQPNFARLQHLPQNRAPFANLPQDQADVCFRDLLDKLIIFGVARLTFVGLRSLAFAAFGISPPFDSQSKSRM